MRIGVITELYAAGEGSGAFDFLKLVLRGLESEKDNEIYLFFRSDTQIERIRRFPIWMIKIIERFLPSIKNPNIETFSEFKNAHVVDYKMLNLNKQISVNKIDVVFPSMLDLGQKLTVKWCGNLWDCQHKYYPQYFSWYMMLYRDWYHNRMLKHSNAIIVNSQNAKDDFSKFYRVNPDKIKVLPLLPTLNHSLIGNDDVSVLNKYGLNKPFFLISNRFWRHKSHDIAIKALDILIHKRNYEVYLVCTGFMTDYRDKTNSYFKYLLNLINELGLADYVKLPGMVPKKDQIEMMKCAISVIQPSKFEGDCSGQIIDAITIGQRSICSDIEVLKEVENTGYVTYFKLDDYDDLADKMEKFIKTPYTRPSYDKLIEQEENNLNRFSVAVNNIITDLTK